MKLIALIFFITTHFWLNAQVINVVEHEWEADIKVFFTSLEWNADVVVLPTKSLHHARSIEGHLNKLITSLYYSQFSSI